MFQKLLIEVRLHMASCMFNGGKYSFKKFKSCRISRFSQSRFFEQIFKPQESPFFTNLSQSLAEEMLLLPSRKV